MANELDDAAGAVRAACAGAAIAHTPISATRRVLEEVIEPGIGRLPLMTKEHG
jgi:hypothetical protein